MKTNIIFTTLNNNSYLYNLDRMEFYYLHPIVKILYEYYVEYGYISEDILNNTKYLKQLRSFTNSQKNIDYHLAKLNFLIENEVVTNKGFSPKTNWTTITPELMRYQVINTKVVLFEVTEKCNLKCFYCGYGDLYNQDPNRKGVQLTFEKAKILFDELIIYWGSNTTAASNKRVIIGFYGGEPLLNIKLIKKIVLYLLGKQTNELKFDFRLTTNGLLLNKYIDYLYQNNFSILISLDGDKIANKHRKLPNGKESFSKVIDNINLVQKKYPAYFKNHVNFNSVLTKNRSFLEVLKFFQKKYKKSPNITSLAGSNLNKENIEEYWKIYLNKDSSFLEALKSEPTNTYLNQTLFVPRLESFLKTHLRLRVFNINELIYRDFLPFVKTRGCLPFSLKIYLSARGDLLPCEKVHPQFSFGHVYDKKIFDFEKIAEKYRFYLEEILQQCSTCYQSNKCGYCLFLCDTHNERMYCSEYMSEQNFSNYLAKRFTNLESFYSNANAL